MCVYITHSWQYLENHVFFSCIIFEVKERTYNSTLKDVEDQSLAHRSKFAYLYMDDAAMLKQNMHKISNNSA